MSRRKRRKLTTEFEAEVVQLCRAGDRSIGEVARDLDLTETAVREWPRLRALVVIVCALSAACRLSLPSLGDTGPDRNDGHRDTAPTSDLGFDQPLLIDGARTDSCPASSAAFDAQQVARFRLPVPYAEVVEGLRYLLTAYPGYLTSTAPPTVTTKLACPKSGSSETIVYHNLAQNWTALAYLARALYDGYWITLGDCHRPDLSGKLRQALLAVADHILEGANADTEGILLTDPLSPPSLVPTIAWTNLASSWDAWANGTCSPPGRPNLWSSGWALHALAAAYRVSNDIKYARGFRLGAAYWHASSNSPGFTDGYDGYAAAKALFDKHPPWKLKRLYTVGGSRFSVGSDPREAVVRYHYLSDDPARFALNDVGIMALDMVLMGLVAPSDTFAIADPVSASDAAYLARSYLSIGRAAMRSVAGNLELGNAAYEDLDSVGSNGATAFEDHFDFTAYYVAHAGTLLGETRFIDAARELLLNVTPELEAHLAATGTAPYGYCLSRSLHPTLFDRCVSWLKKAGGAHRTSFYYLFAAIIQLDR